jgi:hypothetical protein
MKNMGVWRMSLDPASVCLATTLPLMDAVEVMRARGEPPLYTLSPFPWHTRTAPQVVHTVSDPGMAGARWDAEHMTLSVRAAPEELSAEGLLYMAYLLLEAALQRHGYVTLHAAAACRDRRAVLLLGPAGAGKTTTLLRLCRDHGAAMVGNDLVVAGGPGGRPVALAGSHHVRLRHASIARAMPELLGLFPGDVADPWRAKRDLAPARLGIEAASGPVEITVVAFVHVDTEYRVVVDAPGDTLVHRLNLHENAVRYIRGASTPWMSGTSFGPYLPSFDNPNAHAARAATLERLLTRSRYIAGPPAAVAERLAVLLETEESASVGSATRRTS